MDGSEDGNQMSLSLGWFTARSSATILLCRFRWEEGSTLSPKPHKARKKSLHFFVLCEVTRQQKKKLNLLTCRQTASASFLVGSLYKITQRGFVFIDISLSACSSADLHCAGKDSPSFSQYSMQQLVSHLKHFVPFSQDVTTF